MLPHEKREETRFTTKEQVTVRVPGSKGFCAGRVVDFSPLGLGVLLPTSLPIGATVIVEHRGAHLIGKAGYLVADGNQFRVGIRLETLTATKTGISQLAEATERYTSAG